MKLSHSLPAVLTTLWASTIAIGFAFMIDFEVTPGDAGAPPRSWPDDSAIARVAGRPELLMLVHPHCPCSRSSLDELEKLMARCRDRVSVHVLIVTPAGAADRWGGAQMRRRAEAIPGVMVLDDIGAAEAGRFKIATSGHSLLYDVDGSLRFSGGITPARGHEGDNAGARAIIEFALDRRETRGSAPVFGCPLAEAPGSRR